LRMSRSIPLRAGRSAGFNQSNAATHTPRRRSTREVRRTAACARGRRNKRQTNDAPATRRRPQTTPSVLAARDSPRPRTRSENSAVVRTNDKQVTG
jgi:uncharacterized cupin superfamily protein